MLTRDHDIIAFQLVHKLIFNYKWTQKEEDKLQDLARLIEAEDPKEYPGNMLQIFIDVYGKIQFILKYYPKRL